MATLSVEKGTILQSPDTDSRHGYFVMQGLLRSYFVDDAGKEYTMIFAPQGWTIADLEAFGFNRKTRLVIEALEFSVVRKFNLHDVASGHSQDLAIELKHMHRRVGALQLRVLMLMSTSALDRYEYFLQTYPELSNRVSQKLIASYLGVTPQALSTIRKRRVKGE